MTSRRWVRQGTTCRLNQAKGDKDPAKWLPPPASFRCTYAVTWVQVKSKYGLAVDAAEKTTLARLLDAC